MSRGLDGDAHSGRRTPPTVVHDVDTEQPYERSIPIQVTEQPAAVIYRGIPATQAEKTPFLYKETDVLPNSGQTKERLTLVRGNNDIMDDPVEGRGWRASLSKYTKIKNEYVRDFLAEFLGSFILIVSLVFQFKIQMFVKFAKLI